MPFRIMPDLGQVSENGSHPSTKQRCHVFQDREARSNHANGSNHFPPQSRTGSGKSGACPRKANILARKSGADDVGIRVLRCGHVAHVGNARKPCFKDARGVWISLGKSDGFKAARTVQTEGKTADASEEIKHPHAATW
jgi:hypothetical protein